MRTPSLTKNGAVITVSVLLVAFVTFRLAVPVATPVMVTVPKPAPIAITTPVAPAALSAPETVKPDPVVPISAPVAAPAPAEASLPPETVPPPIENKIAIQVPDPLLIQHQNDLLSIKDLEDKLASMKIELSDTKAQLVDVTDKAAMWQSIMVQQDTLLDVFNTAVPDLPVYRQNVYVVISLPQATFDFNSTKLSDASQRRLALIAKIFNRYDGIFYLGIEGHTDNVPVKIGGKYADNVALGMARANRAYQVLLQAGVAPEKMAVISWGSSLPAISHATQQSEPANRRVELVFAPRRAIEQPEPVASLLTPEVRERLRAYSETFLNNRNMLHFGTKQLQPIQDPSPIAASAALPTAYVQTH